MELLVTGPLSVIDRYALVDHSSLKITTFNAETTLESQFFGRRIGQVVKVDARLALRYLTFVFITCSRKP